MDNSADLAQQPPYNGSQPCAFGSPTLKAESGESVRQEMRIESSQFSEAAGPLPFT
jgi:hypothetical protein